jgi:hypothetical protein
MTLFLFLSLLYSVQHTLSLPTHTPKQTTQSDIRGKAQDKSTDKILKLTLTAPTKPLRVGDYLNFGYKITNISNQTVLLPDLLNTPSFVLVTDHNLKSIPLRLGSGYGRPSINGRSGYANTITLGPSHYWGSDTAIQALKIELKKPGQYLVRIIVQKVIHEELYPEWLWKGRLEATLLLKVEKAQPTKSSP